MRKLTLLLACVAVPACTDFFGVRTPTDLESARNRWERTRPEAYVFAIERLCFCPVEYIGPVRIWVEGDSVVARVFVDGGDPVPQGIAEAFPTVGGLFGVLTEAYEQGADEVRATYDSATGVPLDFWIDYSEMMADEELGFRVTEEVTATAP
jgi:hypothetical protein